MINQRLIFTVTTGRSGTGLLSTQLKHVTGATVHHEATPNFADVMRSAQNDPLVAKKFWLNDKLPAIQGTPSSVYIETSHLFCKGFLEPLLHLGVIPELILLRRPHRDVAKSLTSLRTIPARTENGCRYLLSPDDPNVIQLSSWTQLSDYQLCYWYCLEIERRMKQYAKLITDSGGRTYEIAFHNLITGGFLRQFLVDSNLHLVTPLKSAPSRVNGKEKSKQALPPIDYEREEQELEQLINP